MRAGSRSIFGFYLGRNLLRLLTTHDNPGQSIFRSERPRQSDSGQRWLGGPAWHLRRINSFDSVPFSREVAAFVPAPPVAMASRNGHALDPGAGREGSQAGRTRRASGRRRSWNPPQHNACASGVDAHPGPRHSGRNHSSHAIERSEKPHVSRPPFQLSDRLEAVEIAEPVAPLWTDYD